MSISNFFNDEMTLEKFTGRDEFGNALPASESRIYGRFEFSDFLMQSQRGEEVMAKAVLFIPATTSIDQRDFIRKDDIRYRVMQVRKPANRRAIHHQEVILA